MKDIQILDSRGQPMPNQSMGIYVGDAYDGASAESVELASWLTGDYSADSAILGAKSRLDARTHDAARNDGYVNSSRNIFVDNVVGHQFKLSAKPNWKYLRRFAQGFDGEWATEFSDFIEAEFSDYAEDEDFWIDAEREATLTEQCRTAMFSYFDVGEACASAEWLTRTGTPYRTCLKMIDASRLSNPNNQSDTLTLRKGVVNTRRGEPRAYWIRESHPGEHFVGQRNYKWRKIQRHTPWGRLVFLHIFSKERAEQSRAIGALVSTLKEVRSLKKLEETYLQNAVMNALYAATLESDMDATTAFETIGVDVGENSQETFKYIAYLNEVAKYTRASGGVKVGGVKVPHLPPGTKLNLLSASKDKGMGSDFHKSLLRHIGAGLGLSYPQFSRDLSDTNYSSIKFGIIDSLKMFGARRKYVPGRYATAAYRLWLEERMQMGGVPLPNGAPSFWQAKAAYSRCTWIATGRGQIDEIKETNAAVLRIAFNLSTLEKEVGNLGEDYREILEQRAKELQMIKSLKIPTFNPKATGLSGEFEEAEEEETDNAEND